VKRGAAAPEASDRVIPSRADGEEPRRRSFASALDGGRQTLDNAVLFHDGAICI
jgi:hypothetical protein